MALVSLTIHILTQKQTEPGKGRVWATKIMQHNIIVTLINDLQNHKSCSLPHFPASPSKGFVLQKQPTHLQNVLIITKQNVEAHEMLSSLQLSYSRRKGGA